MVGKYSKVKEVIWMEQPDYYLYITFPSVHNGLALENQLKEEKIPFTVVPTPREISQCCGISIRFTEEWRERIRAIIEKNGVVINGIHKRAVNPQLKKLKFI
jgi:hypothetical protein